MSEPRAGLPGWHPSRRIRRVAFWLYAGALFTATHWPRLEIPETIIQRPDLIIHLSAFGLWTLLLIATEYAGVPLRRSTIGWCWLIGLANAGADEGLQAIPFVHRTCAWDDWGADAAGVTLAAIAVVWIARRAKAT